MHQMIKDDDEERPEYRWDADTALTLPFYIVEIDEERRSSLHKISGDGLLTLEPQPKDVIIDFGRVEYYLVGDEVRLQAKNYLHSHIVQREALQFHGIGADSPVDSVDELDDLGQMLAYFVTSNGYIHRTGRYIPVVLKSIGDFDTPEEYSEACKCFKEEV